MEGFLPTAEKSDSEAEFGVLSSRETSVYSEYSVGSENTSIEGDV